MARRFREILERKKAKPKSGSPVRKQGGQTAWKEERPRGTPTPAVRKSVGIETKNRERRTEPKPGEKFRNLMASKRQKEGAPGFKERDVDAPTKVESGADTRQRLEEEGIQPGTPEYHRALAEAKKGRVENREMMAETGNIPQPKGSPADHAQAPGERREILPAMDEDAFQEKARGAMDRVRRDETELGELPPQERRMRAAEEMLKEDISTMVESTEPQVEPQAIQMNRMPKRHELASVTKGMTVQTPFGDMTRSAVDGTLEVSYSPLMKEKLEQRRKVELKKFGNYPGMTDPNSPPPPIEPGQRSFNPFTGTWVNDEESILKRFMSRE